MQDKTFNIIPDFGSYLLMKMDYNKKLIEVPYPNSLLQIVSSTFNVGDKINIVSDNATKIEISCYPHQGIKIIDKGFYNE